MSGIPEADRDPILQYLLRGEARTLDEAEELYLDASLAEITRLIGSEIPDEELSRHPLLVLLRAHGSRGWEDSLV